MNAGGSSLVSYVWSPAGRTHAADATESVSDGLSYWHCTFAIANSEGSEDRMSNS